MMDDDHMICTFLTGPDETLSRYPGSYPGAKFLIDLRGLKLLQPPFLFPFIRSLMKFVSSSAERRQKVIDSSLGILGTRETGGFTQC
jgi:hypothetical protein